MAVDTSAAESARSLLNGIDYSALIGGPLQAAITAQAMAAKSTWEFIQEVGLNEKDADGNRSAINVSFLYQSDGEMVRLVVPILVIVPIPLIVVDEIAIDFTASINASASSTSEDVKSQDIGGELDAEAKVGWGPFSLTARMKASYSSKQASKATQDSRYSVEYTQVVRVHARQADMPAGLATVLNILSSAATGGTPNGELSVSPPDVRLGATDTPMLEIRTKGASGINVASDVILSLNSRFDGCFVLTDPMTGDVIAWTVVGDAIEASAKTNKNGRLRVGIALASPTQQVPTTTPYPILLIKATINGDDQETPVPINVVPSLPSSAPALTPNSPAIAVIDGTNGQIVLTGTPTAAAAGATITPALTTGFTVASPSSLVLGQDGTLMMEISKTSTAPEIGFADFHSVIGGQAVSASVELIEVVTMTSRNAVRLAALQRPSHVGGLTAQPETTRQTWTVVRERDGVGVDAPVRALFEPSIIRVRSNGNLLAPGDIVQFDEQNTARLEFEIRAGVPVGETQVVLETEGDGGLQRQVFPVRIS